ncbi:t-SNARE coiled-coil homology domain-containing protein [Meloidogyne graminicola]|uniref:t-SNARE coiled-coil homology domain-containing protein n=1 Tax=Meloidogyne graminicola TaxID=189291 RepID=A0A8T0A4H0_9BILA|nr:t-SNARE coiled-coil homology domain-containing protein [Meloidogyne graminicola]
MTSTMAALLNDFEQRYSINTAEITSKIGQLQQLTPSEVPSAANEVKKLLMDVEDLLEQMELSVREIEPSNPDRQKYDLRVKSYKSDKKQLEVELRKAVDRVRNIADRDELMTFNDAAINIDQQDKLIANTERLDAGTRKLQNCERITIETEQIGEQVLGNLSLQRETLTRNRDRMREANSDLGRSNRILSQMIRRVIQNRLVLLVVFVVLMFSLLYLVYKVI